MAASHEELAKGFVEFYYRNLSAGPSSLGHFYVSTNRWLECHGGALPPFSPSILLRVFAVAVERVHAYL
jgi:hypothetical protein